MIRRQRSAENEKIIRARKDAIASLPQSSTAAALVFGLPKLSEPPKRQTHHHHHHRREGQPQPQPQCTQTRTCVTPTNPSPPTHSVPPPQERNPPRRGRRYPVAEVERMASMPRGTMPVDRRRYPATAELGDLPSGDDIDVNDVLTIAMTTTTTTPSNKEEEVEQHFFRKSTSSNSTTTTSTTTDDANWPLAMDEWENYDDYHHANNNNHCEEEDDGIIEVAPGIYKLLRGAEATSAALERGECIDAMCYICHIRLACMEDCECVVCPACLSISPNEAYRRTTTNETGWAGMGIPVVEG